MGGSGGTGQSVTAIINLGTEPRGVAVSPTGH
jgi:DNA-binding beta-propeller fold protein YncE